MLTARADVEDKLSALRIGVDDYMLKPFIEAELLARINNLLEFRSQRQQVTTEAAGKELNKATTAPKPVVTRADHEWLAQLEQLVSARVSEYDFSVESLAEELQLSRQHLTRSIKRLTGLTAVKYVQEARLNHARSLLEQQEVRTVKAASQASGFRDVKYFSKLFAQRFGKQPSGYLRQGYQQLDGPAS